MNIIKIGDSRELLKQLESKSVNAVYFDPPFNSNRNYRLTSDKNSLGFDDVFVDDDEYTSLIDPMLKECARVLTKDGSLFFHISADQMLIPHMLCSRHFKHVQPIFWKRSRSKNNTKSKLGACTDIIFKCSNTKKPKLSFHDLQSRVTQLTRSEPRLFRKHYLDVALVWHFYILLQIPGP